MPRKPSDTLTCCYPQCPHQGKVITAAGALDLVRVGHGPMHADCHRRQTEIVTRLLTPRPDAVPWMTVCELCREWVDGIYAVTFIGLRICITCAAKSGDAAAISSLTAQGLWDPKTGQPCRRSQVYTAMMKIAEGIK